MAKEITAEEYIEADNELAGFCTHCQEIVNHGGCEPDAREYKCEECERNTVYGAAEALLMGLITIGEGE